MAEYVERVGLVGGSGAAAGIVFVHGTRVSGAYWHVQLAALSRQFRTVAVDLPGHGSRRGETFSHGEAMDTIRRGIDLCQGSAAVVGHSLGGFLAMDFAAQAPGKCRGLVLVGCTANARGPSAWPYRAAARLLPLVPQQWLVRRNEHLLARRYSTAVIGPQMEAGFGFAALGASWRSVFGTDHASALAAYRGSLLFVNGEHDWLFRAGEHRFLRASPRSRLLVLSGAGHLCNLDRPVEFTDAVQEFANELEPTPGSEMA